MHSALVNVSRLWEIGEVMLLINGVTGSLGESVLKLSLKQGLDVVGVGRNVAKLAELRQAYPSSVFLPIEDITSEEEALRVILEFESVTNNKVQGYLHAAAALSRSTSPIETSLDNFQNAINVNLTGAFVWNKTVMKRMMINQLPGVILNVASQAARTGGYGGATSYAASKGGLISLTKSFARFGASNQIRVNCISPGFLNNQMMLGGLTSNQKEEFIEKTALKRLAEIHEVAEVALFLLSAGSSYITGENLEVSAGLSLG
jgi:3-oxoacyl-[acyl-carrier protein] reductase